MYRNGQYVSPPTATINSSFDFTIQKVIPITSLNNDRFTYSGNVTSKYAQAIIDCVKMTGMMSLKNDNHSACGATPAQTKKIAKEAVETRKAADVLLASGAIVLMGTWSNGIQVGPGKGFARIDHSAPAAKPAKKSRKSNPNSTKAQIAAYAASHQEERDAHASEEGASCDWYPTIILEIVCSYDVDAPVSKPRYRVPLAVMQAACGVTPASVEAAPAHQPMWLDGQALVINPAFVASVNAYRAAHPEDTRFAPLAVEMQAATVAQMQETIADEDDAMIDGLIDSIIGYDIAAG
jgi:hypothetical protein